MLQIVASAGQMTFVTIERRHLSSNYDYDYGKTRISICGALSCTSRDYPYSKELVSPVSVNPYEESKASFGENHHANDVNDYYI
jgi:hypothetical protein